MIDKSSSNDDMEHDGRFDAIVDEVLEQQRAGIKPQLADFEQRYPDHAQQLRDIFSTLLMAERMDNELSRASQQAASLKARSNEEFPKQLGDFELLQELGRGGMGVVFAAHQISLNRMVALKVLSRHLAVDSRFAERFAREARSAAHLQHPHIVSVFSNGCDQGISYYAMQLIEGKNLAEVLDSVRRIFQKEQSDEEVQDDQYLRRLLSTAGSKSPSQTVRVSSPTNAPPKTLQSSATDNQPNEAKVALGRENKLGSDSKDSSKLKSSARLSDYSNRSKRSAYYKNIAAMARDVAWALEYAHQQGTVHRDIKPSNLILDRNGKVWITDFGLAKIESEQRLTQAGDMLGTLRYVAPEQLDGISAPSCDVYGVGVTLYELAAFVPAWTGENHAQIMNRVRSDSVIRPRSIEPSIPSDLETVILTAMARNPSDRYRSARELGDDLERFCNDQPIRARKPSSLESLIRWSRRNRLTAASIAVVLFLAAVVVPIITIAYSIELGQEVSRSRTAERQTKIANANSKWQLVESLIQQARAVRENQSLSAREDCIGTLKEANRVLQELGEATDNLVTHRMQLRDEAIAALALPEFHEAYRLPLQKSQRESSDFIHAKDDLIVLRERAVEKHYTTVRDRRVMEKIIFQHPEKVEYVRINRRKTHMLTHSQADGYTILVTIWRIADGAKIWSERLPNYQGLYTPGEEYVIGLENTGRPILVHVESGRVSRGATVCDPVDGLPAIYCSPSAKTIALVYPKRFEIRNFKDGKLLKRVHAAQGRVEFQLAIWSPADDWFAVKSTNGVISVYDPKTWASLRFLLCDLNGGTKFSVTEDGRYLESTTWTRRFEIFDMLTGGRVLRFVPTGENEFLDFSEYLIGPLCDSEYARMMQFKPSIVYRTRPLTTDAILIPSDLCLTNDGRLAAARIPKGKLALMDLKSNATLTAPVFLSNMAFDSTGNLWGAVDGEIFRWPAIVDAEVIRYGNPTSLGRINASSFAIDPSGQTIAWNLNSGVAIAKTVQLETPQIRKAWGDVRRLEMSSDRNWVVAPEHNAFGCWVFDVNSEASWDLTPNHRLVLPKFSDDGKYLALTVPDDSLRLYRCGEWEKPIRTWNATIGQPAFSPDGKFLAASFDMESINLISLDDFEPKIRLTHPTELRLLSLSFTRDGSKLLFTGDESNCVHEWDLVALRQELESVGLDATPLPHGSVTSIKDPHEDVNTKENWIEFAPETRLVELWREAIIDDDEVSIRECLEKLIQIVPDNPRYQNGLAWSLIQDRKSTRDDQARALGLVRQALASHGDNADYLNTYGVILYRLEQYNEAIEVLDNARGLRTAEADPLDDYFLAMAFARLARLDDAKTAWSRGMREHLRSKPDDKECSNALFESAILILRKIVETNVSLGSAKHDAPALPVK